MDSSHQRSIARLSARKDSMTTAEIKARIEAMFSDGPAFDAIESAAKVWAESTGVAH
ncbi:MULTISPECIES: hypothetical protein [Rhodococcus]|uniref:hypothetical protein n=1 Tax=Rhodococcus TaxID=1827 RepID=UPI0015C2F64B|nr:MULTISPECIES: hypothetical protein [Rhodococcus]